MRIKESKEKRNLRTKQYRADNPWAKTLTCILTRCNDHARFPSYHRKGIKNYLNTKDLKYLWFRDKAYLLKEPSIDRINNNKGYTLSNCRYIELVENSRK